MTAVGDITTDAFIRIKQASVHKADGEEKLCLTNGSKIPYEFVSVAPAVGNSPNAAVAAARLGLKSALATDMGDDQNGKDCLASLEKDGVNVSFVKRHADKKTNYHYVLWYKDERTILIKHEEYDYKLPDIGSPKWIYLSSIGENSLSYHQEIADYLKAHSEIKLAFQPGTFQIKMGIDVLKDIYSLSHIFFSNVEEARIILGNNSLNAIGLARAMSDHGPKITVITDGPKGAYIFDKEKNEGWFMPPYPDLKPPYERTGAGDAYASTFVSALALGKPLEETMRWAPVNSMSVVQKIGAQEGLLSQEEIEKYLASAPSDFCAKPLS